MALGQRLDLRQTQGLVMTPQLQQAIKLLQMSNLEVQAYVERELDQNPLLEREDSGGGLETDDAVGSAGADGATAGEPAQGAATEADDGLPATVDVAGTAENFAATTETLDADYGNVWSGADDIGASDTDSGQAHWVARGGYEDSDGSDVESVAAQEISLRDHLLSQINVDLEDPVDRMIAVHLVDGLDETGYLTADLDALALQLGCDLARIHKTLNKLQKFDPPGIFARDLAECLRIQLREAGRLTPPLSRLLDHLDILGRRDFQALKRVCRLESEEITELVTIIKSLNPRPASAFDRMVIQPVTPDVLVRSRPDGQWLVELNPDTMPRVLINSRYYALVNKKARNKDERDYLAERLQSASWLVKALHQRAQTILKVASEIVRRQEQFLNDGIKHLRPLTLHDVGETVGVHESTVSRVANNKYMATPRGVFELRYFFGSAVGQEAGDTLSAEALRFRIKALIEAEADDDVLSDDRIVELLRHDGIEVARRTVAKYREALQIPSSVQRRRGKMLQF